MDYRLVVAVVFLAVGASCWALAAWSQRPGGGRQRWQQVGVMVVGAGLVGGGLAALQAIFGLNGWIAGAAGLALGVVVILTQGPRARRGASSRAATMMSRS